MTNSSTEAGAAAAPMGLLSRFVGVITSPKATFQSVVAHPRWLGMLLLTCAAVSVLVGGFLMTQGRPGCVARRRDQQSVEPRSDVAISSTPAWRGMAPYVGYLAVVQMLVVLPIVYRSRRASSTCLHDDVGRHGIVQAAVRRCRAYGCRLASLAQLFTVPMNFAAGLDDEQDQPRRSSCRRWTKRSSARLLGTIDLFLIWQFVVLAIGLGVLYRRRTQPIAIGLFVVYGVIALTIAAVMSRFGGSN